MFKYAINTDVYDKMSKKERDIWRCTSDLNVCKDRIKEYREEIKRLEHFIKNSMEDVRKYEKELDEINKDE